MKNKICLLISGLLISAPVFAKTFNCTALGETVGFGSSSSENIFYNLYTGEQINFKLNDNAAGIQDNVYFGPIGKTLKGESTKQRLSARIMQFSNENLLVLTLNDDDIVSTNFNSNHVQINLYRPRYGSATNFSIECRAEI